MITRPPSSEEGNPVYPEPSMNTRVIVALAVAASALLTACGDSAEACFTNPVGVAEEGLTGGCDAGLAANTPLTINLNLCPTCAQTDARCDGDVQQGTIQLDSRVNECESDRGCDVTSCLSRPVSCPLNQTLSPGSYRVLYLNARGTQSTATVQVGPGGASTCTL